MLAFSLKHQFQVLCETLPEVWEEVPVRDAHLAALGGHSWPQRGAELESGMGIEKQSKDLIFQNCSLVLIISG